MTRMKKYQTAPTTGAQDKYGGIGNGAVDYIDDGLFTNIGRIIFI